MGKEGVPGARLHKAGSARSTIPPRGVPGEHERSPTRPRPPRHTRSSPLATAVLEQEKAGTPSPPPTQVHFMGYRASDMDWIPMDSNALAPFRCFTTRSVSLVMLSVKDTISRADPLARTNLAFCSPAAPPPADDQPSDCSSSPPDALDSPPATAALRVRLFPYLHDMPLAHPAGVTLLYEVLADTVLGAVVEDFLSVALPGRQPVGYGEEDEWAEMLVPVVARFGGYGGCGGDVCRYLAPPLAPPPPDAPFFLLYVQTCNRTSVRQRRKWRYSPT